MLLIFHLVMAFVWSIFQTVMVTLKNAMQMIIGGLDQVFIILLMDLFLLLVK